MQTIYRSALVAFSAQQMFDLVDDIENYQAFVPYCQSSEVLKRETHQVTAKLVVAKSGLAKSFTTCNQLNPPNQISMQLVDGPFSHLSGHWNFVSLSDKACKIELQLEFEFSNALTSLAFSKVFNKLVGSMITAFTERAEKIYGN